MTPSIKVTVGPEGGVAVETEGFTGEACRDASRWLELALGRTAGETLKPEFYQAQAAQGQGVRQ